MRIIGDEGLTEALHGVEDGDELAAACVKGEQAALVVAGGWREVAAAAKVLACAGEDDGGDGFVGGAVVEVVDERGEKGAVKGVASVGAVERERGDAVL